MFFLCFLRQFLAGVVGVVQANLCGIFFPVLNDFPKNKSPPTKKYLTIKKKKTTHRKLKRQTKKT